MKAKFLITQKLRLQTPYLNLRLSNHYKNKQSINTLIKLKKKFYNIPIFLPELACPHRCIFCNQEKISNTQNIPSTEDCKKIIETNLSTMPQDAHTMIAFFGGNFTGLSQALQIKYLQTAQPYLENEKIKGIRLSTRPDYISEETLKILKQYNVTNIELGAQSFDNEVLEKSYRGHSASQTTTASKMILDYGFTLGLQMMTGLPGDTKGKSLYTAKKIIALQAAETRIYPALVIENTVLAKLYKQGKYNALSMNETIDRLKDIIPLFENAGVKILRVGLHKSKDLDNPKNLLAGPYHPSLKELVRSRIFFEKIKNKLNSNKNTCYTIVLPPNEINYAIGYKSENKKKFTEMGYNLKFEQSTEVNSIKVICKNS